MGDDNLLVSVLQTLTQRMDHFAEVLTENTSETRGMKEAIQKQNGRITQLENWRHKSELDEAGRVAAEKEARRLRKRDYAILGAIITAASTVAGALLSAQEFIKSIVS